MDPQRWQRLRSWLDRGLDLDVPDHAAFVAALPADDADLRDDLRRLLAEHARTDARAWEDPIALAATRLVGPAQTARDDDRDRVGEQIGPYRLLELIGTGGMGAVYRAERKIQRFTHRVALKVMRRGMTSPAMRERFERERQILAGLVHPNIGTLFEGGETPDGQPYYTMEYVEGVPITDYCRERDLPLETRVALLVDVATALAHAHQNLVVHRDIKPSNILVTADGRVKLLDFGIAKLVGVDADDTHAAFGPMTPEYAAPEQFHNAAVTVATDVYQFGVLCFRLLTGNLPYRASVADGLAWAQAVSTQEPQSLARALDAAHAWKAAPNLPRLRRRLSGDLDAIVRKALAKAPADRYRSIDAMGADLAAFLRGAPVSARAPRAAYLLQRFVQRHVYAVAAGMLATLLLLGATAFSLRAAHEAKRHAHRAEVANRFLLTALDITDVFSDANRGDYSLSEVIERAVTQARSALRDEPEVRADVLSQLSLALQHRGKLDAALSAANEAYELRFRTADSEPLELAAVSQQLASLEIEMGRLDDAARHLDDTVRQLERAGDQERRMIQAHTSHGKLASMRGDAEASLRRYRLVLGLRQALPGDNSADIAMDYGNLGTGLFNLSRFGESREAFERALDVAREHLGPQHARTAFLECGLASVLMHLAEFGAAGALLDHADAVLRPSGASATPITVNTDHVRAAIDFYRSDYARAVQHSDAALAQMRSASPVSVAGGLIIRGRIELALGNTDAAQRRLRESEALFLANGRGDHAQRWYAHGLLGAAGDDAQLDEAIRELMRPDRHAGFELVDLSAHAGAAARRRGDIAAALQAHRRGAALRQQLGWLGALGQAHAEAELALDGLTPGADAEARAAAPALRSRSIVELERLAPRDPLLTALRAAPL
jgi:serine/threonine-protein kinase